MERQFENNRVIIRAADCHVALRRHEARQGATGVYTADQRGENGDIVCIVLSEPAGGDRYLPAGDVLHYHMLPFIEFIVVQTEKSADVGFSQSFKGTLKSGTGAFDQIYLDHGAI